MVWQDAFSPTGGPAFDAESERERRLAAQARAGAEWALTALIARYQPTVVRYLTRLCGNQAQAQALAERIFQRMERRLHGPHGAENLRLWLLRASTEAGLDVVRHPQGRSTPRLTTSGVAGLLTPVSGKDAPRFLQKGLSRLRKAAGGASRQERPLVWADDARSASSPRMSRSESPQGDSGDSGDYLDETLDRLDPREALRHRLVRVTLAELPYGDAQCLALHLVAGLNQAEVARALGITNSAARKRIVHGLALFSDRYTLAVESLGLPVELGFGDAIPRPLEESEPVQEPAPEPVVVSSQAPEEDDISPDEDRLIGVSGQPNRGRDALSHVSYVTEDSIELPAIDDDFADASTFYDDLFVDDTVVTGAHAHTGDAHEPPAEAAGNDQASESLLAEADPAPVSGGFITRVAADAIVGPVVDALPVEPATPLQPDLYGIAGPRSMPLGYELSSNAAFESSGITMNWLDNRELMTPLTFESVAETDGSFTLEPKALAPTDDEPLTLESVALPDDSAPGADAGSITEDEAVTYEAAASADEAPIALEAATLEPADEMEQAFAEPPSERADAAVEDELSEPAEAEIPLEPVTVPVVTAPVMTVPVVTAPAGAAHDPWDGFAEAPVTVPVLSPAPADLATVYASDNEMASEPLPRTNVISRSLEDVWNELSDRSDV
ncbi:MAG TPA: sigma factor-like helix-turn-helix DNA-binding protein [Ktedonobacterales bacterium]